MTALLHHTDHTGKEPAVVLVHGMACDGSDWDAQVAYFSGRGHRVITVDLRGHGQSMQFERDFNMPSMGGDVAALLKHLKVGAAVVAGHSMGCRVATETALQLPDVVRGVALVDGSRFANSDADAAVASRRSLIERLGFAEHMEANFDSMFLPGADHATKARIVERARQRPAAIGTEVMLSMVHWDAAQFEARYSELKVPAQVIQSTHIDRSKQRVAITDDMPVEWHEELLACGVAAQFERVPDCGHFTMIDAPDAVNSCIDKLLTRIAA